MKQVLVSSYQMAVAAVAKIRYRTMASYNKIIAACSRVKEWMLNIGLWTLVLSIGVLLSMLGTFAIVQAPTAYVPQYVDWCLSTVSKREGLFGEYKAGMSSHMAILGSVPYKSCSLYLSNLSIALFLIRFLTRMVQQRSRANLSLCSKTKGPSSRGIRCGVCWGDMDAADDTLVHGNCQHSWHTACLEEIAKYEQGAKGYAPCPICRKPMNQESKIGGLLRRLPSGIDLREDKLERLSSIAFHASSIFAIISLGVFLARSRSIEDQQKHPALVLAVPPIGISMAVFVAATALALEQLLLIKRFILLRPVFTRLLINVGFLMALITAGCQLEVPANLTVDLFANTGLQRGHALYPTVPTVNWWVWLGESYIMYSSVASAGLVGALILATGAWDFQYA